MALVQAVCTLALHDPQAVLLHTDTYRSPHHPHRTTPPCPARLAVDALEACAGVRSKQPLAGPPTIPPRCHQQVLQFEAWLARHQVPPAGEGGG